MMRKVVKIAVGIFILSLMLVLSGCDLTPPSAPYISGNYTNTQTNIWWSSVSGAREYIIYIKPYTGSAYYGSTESFTRFATTTSTSYTDYTTSARFYAVKASNNAGTSEFSNVIYSK